MKKKEIRLKEPVRIHEKKISGGNINLYLDIYQNGLRKKETLKLYLVPEINAATKLQNANTRKLAEQIKAQRILDIQKESLVDWEKVKKAFLFLGFTGLRYSDMKALNWSEIHKAADGKTEYIDHIQVKTKYRVTIPLSAETKKWMSEKEEGIDNIFHNLKITSTTVEVVLKEWMEAAGITKLSPTIAHGIQLHR